MANVQIPNLPVAVGLSGAEQLEIVQAGTSMQTTTGAIALFAQTGISDPPTATDGIDYYLALKDNVAVKSHQFMFNVMDEGAEGDNVTDDAAAIQKAIDKAEAAGGGIVYFPAPPSRYKCDSTLTVASDDVWLLGAGMSTILDFSGQASGPGVAFGGVFGWSIKGLTVLNAYGACIEINRGTVSGPHPYAAYGSMEQVAIKGSRVAADNLEIGGCYMSSFNVVRSQDGVRKGIAIYGFCTSLTFTSCHAFNAADDNWQIKNVVYSTFSSCGSDGAGGYGYSLQDADVTMVKCGCETAEYSALEIIFDTGSTSTVKGMNLVLEGFSSLNNNTSPHAGSGWLATTSGTPASTAAGYITIRSLKDLGTAVGNAIEGNGAFIYAIDQQSQRLASFSASPGFSWVGDGATDIPATGPVNITGANTRVATLQPKLRNNLAAYGMLIHVNVSQNNRSSGSRTASYLLHVNKASAGTIGAIATLSAIGNTTGANAADASFTWTFDSTNNELEATPVGSTATGNWYFYVSMLGNGSAIIG